MKLNFGTTLSTILVATIGCAVHAAPYPIEGIPTSFVQPSGKEISLRISGDEFYARTTKDGYRVLFTPEKKAYFYARRAADGKTLESSGVPADENPPELQKDLRDERAVVTAVRNVNVQRFAPQRAANWAARVNAVKAVRSAPPVSSEGPQFVSSVVSATQAAAAPITGEKTGLVILVAFPDDPRTPEADPTPFPTDADKIERLANKEHYTEDGNTGSIRDYYYDQSDGKLKLTQLVTKIVTLDRPRDYYNYDDYPTNTALRDCAVAGNLLVQEAVAKLVASNFDFSPLTATSKKDVIATSLLFAGKDSGVWAAGLWPHASEVAPINVGSTLHPLKIRRYQCTNIQNAAPTMGTITHELGHMVLGFPDFYDYGGESQGLGNHCLMASGNHCNGGRTPAPIDIYLKDIIGWAKITEIKPADAADVEFPSIGNIGYRIRKPGSSSEYFLIENRGEGDKWAAHVPDRGIAIWHVDEAVHGNNNEQMTKEQHYEIALQEADGKFELEKSEERLPGEPPLGNRGDAADLFDTGTPLFSDSTSPNAKWWDASSSGISIKILSAPGKTMKVHFGQ